MPPFTHIVSVFLLSTVKFLLGVSAALAQAFLFGNLFYLQRAEVLPESYFSTISEIFFLLFCEKKAS